MFYYFCFMARLGKEDWLQEGIKILSEFAQDKIKILYLCDRLKVTRGSFYHHFTSIEEYIKELMRYWERKNTTSFINAATVASSPEEQMDVLNQKVQEADHKVEAAIRSWAFYNSIVKECLDNVDHMRLNFLEKVFLKMGEDEKSAKHLAILEYGLLIGIQQLNPSIPQVEMKELFDTYQSKFKRGE